MPNSMSEEENGGQTSNTLTPAPLAKINGSETPRKIATVHPTQLTKALPASSTNTEVAGANNVDGDDEIQIIGEFIDITRGPSLQKFQQAIVVERPSITGPILEIRHEFGYPEKIIQVVSHSSSYRKKMFFDQTNISSQSKKFPNPTNLAELNKPSNDNNKIEIVSETCDQFPSENQNNGQAEKASALLNVLDSIYNNIPSEDQSNIEAEKSSSSKNIINAICDKFPKDHINVQAETSPAIPNLTNVINEEDPPVTKVPNENDNNFQETPIDEDLDNLILLDDNNNMDLEYPSSPEVTNNEDVIPSTDNCDRLCHLKQEQMNHNDTTNNNNDVGQCPTTEPQDNVGIIIPVITNVKSISTFSDDDEDIHDEKKVLLEVDEKLSLEVSIKKCDMLRFHKKNEGIFKFKPKDTRKMTFMLISLFNGKS